MKKKFIFIIWSIIIYSLFFIVSNVYATTFKASEEYSEDYKKWLELPIDERKNYIIPSKYAIDYINENNLEEINAKSSNLNKYDLRDYIDIVTKNQGQYTNSCWTFASNNMFETTYAKLNNLRKSDAYSQRHMEYSCSKYFLDGQNIHGFNRNPGTGGSFYIATAYWSSGKGPILESDMPFVDTNEKIYLSEIQNKKVQAQLEDITMYPDIYKTYDTNGNITYSNGSGTTYSSNDIKSFRDTIKEQIINYGGVGTGTYFPNENEELVKYITNKNGTYSYFCNDMTKMANHAVCIIGWDDNYPKENFITEPPHNGAYLVMNSWGSKLSYFYISYDDIFVEKTMHGIQGISEVDYDNLYQYDEFGMITNIQANVGNVIYGANVFEKISNNNEILNEVGLYIQKNCDVSIYVNANGNNLNINNLEIKGSAKNLTPGYHVIKLNTPIKIGNTFSVIAKYTTNVVPAENSDDSVEALRNISISNLGESFVSTDGMFWLDTNNISGMENSNVCIKAFTLNENHSEEYIINKNLKQIDGNRFVMLSGIDEKITANSLINGNNFNSNFLVKAFKNDEEITTEYIGTNTVIRFYKNSNLEKSFYIVLYGDTNGDGQVSSVDALAVIKNKLDIEKFKNEVFEEAGRVNLKTRTNKSTPSAVDALAIIKNKLGMEKIEQ